jgi:hypothetical protein
MIVLSLPKTRQTPCSMRMCSISNSNENGWCSLPRPTTSTRSRTCNTSLNSNENWFLLLLLLLPKNHLPNNQEWVVFTSTHYPIPLTTQYGVVHYSIPVREWILLLLLSPHSTYQLQVQVEGWLFLEQHRTWNMVISQWNGWYNRSHCVVWWLDWNRSSGARGLTVV